VQIRVNGGGYGIITFPNFSAVPSEIICSALASGYRGRCSGSIPLPRVPLRSTLGYQYAAAMRLDSFGGGKVVEYQWNTILYFIAVCFS